MESCRRSTQPSAFGSPRSQKYQPTFNCPQNRRTPPSGARRRVQAGPAIRDERLRQRPGSTSSARSRTTVRDLLEEHERAGAATSSPSTRRDRPRPRLAIPDGDLFLRLPDVELADLARPIDRALKGPRGSNNGRISDIRVEIVLPPSKPNGAISSRSLRRDLRVGLELRGPSLNGSSFDGATAANTSLRSSSATLDGPCRHRGPFGDDLLIESRARNAFAGFPPTAPRRPTTSS